MLRPLNHWLAVRREEVRPCTPLWIPPGLTAQQYDCCIGQVVAVGRGRALRKALVPHESAPGDRIVYSSRVDSYRPEGDPVDLIEDESIIGFMA